MRGVLVRLTALLGVLWLGGCSPSVTPGTTSSTTSSSASTSDATGSSAESTTSSASETSTSSLDAMSGRVVFGVTSALHFGIDLDRLHVVVTRDGVTVVDRTLTQDGTGDDKLAFPLEVAVDGEDGALVAISLEAFAPNKDAPSVRRLASTHVVKQKELLLRVELQPECIEDQWDPIVCDALLTCIDCGCFDPSVDPATLEDYEADWSTKHADSCKPVNHGAPVVVVGLGMSEYTPASDYDVVQIEQGPAGGHHIWVALEQKNLRRKGSIVEIDGYVPDLDFQVEPIKLIFAMCRADDGYCDLSGLRFQLDLSKDIHELLGKTILITVTVKDPDGDQAVGERWLTLSDTIASYP